MAPNIGQILKLGVKKLKTAKILTANLDAEILLASALKKPREFVYTHAEKTVSPKTKLKFEKLINRRAKREPIAYLTGRKEFYGLDFLVDKRVLIPRPETELIIDEIINFFNCHQPAVRTMADIGAGSGCIAVALKKNLPEAEIFATDISHPALALAQKNAKKNRVKIKFYLGNLCQPIQNKKIDIIVANLPYLNSAEMKNPDLKFEPKTALAGGKNGLLIYEKLFRQIKELKYQPKLILGEIGPAQAKGMKLLAKKYFPSAKAEIKKDLCGLERLLRINLL